MSETGAPSNTSGKPAPRRKSQVRRGLTLALSEPLQQVTRGALGTRNLAEASLMSQWGSIAGGEFARSCWPRRIVFPKRSERREGTLVLKVKPGEATRVAHLEPVLVARVNGFFGYKAVARLRLEHGQLPERTAPAKRPARPLSERERGEVRHNVAAVDDEDLRGALERLGATLRAHDRARTQE